MHDTDIVDTLSLGLSGALVFVGIVALGIVEILAGKPYGAAPLTNDAGEVIAAPAVDPVLRTGLVIAGLALLLVWGGYRMLGSPATPAGQRTSGTVSDD